MKTFRIFEVSEDSCHLKGKITFRLDEENTKILKRLRQAGLKVHGHRNKIIWWDDDYLEIIQKRSEKTVAFMEVVYNA